MIKANIDLSRENRLLRDCSRIKIDDSIKNRLEEALTNKLNWPYILEESMKEGVGYLVYNNLLEFRHKVSEDIWRRFEDFYYRNTYRNIKIYEGMRIILSSFNKEGIKVIPLKGIYLAEKIYKNIALRSMGDIDLLAKKEGLSKIDRVLEGLGYKTSIHKELVLCAIKKSYLNSIDYFKIDERLPTLHIHWHIVNVSLPTYLYTKLIKMDRFFESARAVMIADVETLQLAPHHLIMHLSEHILKHSFDKAILLSDIDAVIGRFEKEIDWEALVKETIEFGMEKQVFYALYLTRDFLDTAIPHYILEKLRPKKTSLLEKRFLNSILNDRRNGKLCYFVYLGMVKGLVNKFRFIFRSFFPPPSILALSLNLNKEKVTLKDYIFFLRKQFLNLKNSLFKKFE
jgi:hypothetical protein